MPIRDVLILTYDELVDFHEDRGHYSIEEMREAQQESHLAVYLSKDYLSRLWAWYATYETPLDGFSDTHQGAKQWELIQITPNNIPRERLLFTYHRIGD